MAERKRDRGFTVRMLGEELDMLSALAEREGLTASDWVRRTIRVAFREAFESPAPKPRRKPKTK